jgi:hypothetical protein
MTANPGFRNYLHDKFNFYNRISIDAYKTYIEDLRKIGAIEIEHAGRNLRYDKQRKRATEAIDAIHDQGMDAILYTGAFGTEDLTKNPGLEQYAQRNINGDVLGYGVLNLKTAMMCPVSDYVEKITIPQILSTLEWADYDGIFFDIPWVLKNGCYCNNCEDIELSSREKNQVIVRQGLEKIVQAIKEKHPEIRISVNASAPTINNNRNTGANIDNLTGLFDEYVTEWNPYRWGQTTKVIERCIKAAKEVTSSKIYHATTCTDGSGKIYSENKLTELFKAIISSGATPRLGIRFPKEQLEIIKIALTNSETL